jgi:hypothetical protein
MACDIARGQIVLFGGFDGSTAIGATWTFDGTNWTQRNPLTVPGARSAPGMTFDATRGRAMMFGGYSLAGAHLDETWEWNGTDWTQVLTSANPPARMFAPLSYDSARQRTVVFGGLAANGSLGDTWEFDGTNWAQVTTATSPSALPISRNLPSGSGNAEFTNSSLPIL